MEIGIGIDAGMGSAVEDVQEDLVARCVAGERDAWRDLHRSYYPVAAAFLRKLGIREAEAEDACQEVFLQVFRYLPRFEGRSDLKTWLYRLCVTQAGRVRRRAQLAAALHWLLPLGGPQIPPSVEPGISEVEAGRRIQAALDGMKPAHRVVLVLYELEGLSGDEIRRIVGCPVATVWRRLHYARRELTASLRGLPEETK